MKRVAAAWSCWRVPPRVAQGNRRDADRRSGVRWLAGRQAGHLAAFHAAGPSCPFATESTSNSAQRRVSPPEMSAPNRQLVAPHDRFLASAAAYRARVALNGDISVAESAPIRCRSTALKTAARSQRKPVPLPAAEPALTVLPSIPPTIRNGSMSPTPTASFASP